MQNATSRCSSAAALLIVVSALATGPTADASSVTTAAAPAPLIHTVESGDTLNRIAAAYRARSGYYGQEDLLAAIRNTNDLNGNLLHPGQQLLVPRRATPECPRVTDAASSGRNLRGIYLTGAQCGYGAVFDRIDAFVAAGGNGVVFDVKDIDGGVSFPSSHPLAVWGKGRSVPPIPSLQELVERLDARGLYIVARIALFLDGELGRQRPDLALQDSLGQPWTERGCVWVDPSEPEVWEYNLGLAGELARAGVDEIQFDYVRFPTNGWRGDWRGDLAGTAERRRGVITRFLQAARDSLAPYDVVISADLFGIMAWGRVADLALTGQHVPTIAAHVDVICPMIYPSHFAPGFEDFTNPGDHPRYFIGEGVRRFAALVDGQAIIRPWLQAFAYRVRDYDAGYVANQMEAAVLAGAAGWSLWNPVGRYEVACTAMAAPRLPVADRLAAAVWLTGPVIGVSPPPPSTPDGRPDVAGSVVLGIVATAPQDPPQYDLLLAAPPIALPEPNPAATQALGPAAAGAVVAAPLAVGPPPDAAWSAPPDRAALTGAVAARRAVSSRRR